MLQHAKFAERHAAALDSGEDPFTALRAAFVKQVNGRMLGTQEVLSPLLR